MYYFLLISYQSSIHIWLLLKCPKIMVSLILLYQQMRKWCFYDLVKGSSALFLINCIFSAHPPPPYKVKVSKSSLSWDIPFCHLANTLLELIHFDRYVFFFFPLYVARILCFISFYLFFQGAVVVGTLNVLKFSSTLKNFSI